MHSHTLISYVFTKFPNRDIDKDRRCKPMSVKLLATVFCFGMQNACRQQPHALLTTWHTCVLAEQWYGQLNLMAANGIDSQGNGRVTNGYSDFKTIFGFRNRLRRCTKRDRVETKPRFWWMRTNDDMLWLPYWGLKSWVASHQHSNSIIWLSKIFQQYE